MQNKKTNPEENNLTSFAEDVLQKAKKKGADSAEVGINTGNGFSVNVRLGEIETIENNRGRQMGLTVYFGKHVGNVLVSDFSNDAVDLAVEKACYIASLTEEDSCCGLADADLMAYDYVDLDLCHPWDISIENAVDMAVVCEKEALSSDKRLVNSEGVSVNSSNGLHVYCNTHGFVGINRSTNHSVSCSLIAKENDEMQRGFDYFVSREPLFANTLSAVAKKAAYETVNRLGAKHLSTRECPVIFRADVAKGVFGSFVSAISGSNLYRKASFLLNHIGKQVFPSCLSIYEDPYVLKALGSSSFDSEGVRTSKRDLVTHGVLNGYVLGSYSARKLNMQTTGNAGGIHNLYVKMEKEMSFSELLRSMGTGFLITELMGDGINIITGDYSRGAFGYWVENGEIQYPVEGITIASNLKDMFLNIIAVSNDIDLRGVIHTGSVLIDKVKIGGV